MDSRIPKPGRIVPAKGGRTGAAAAVKENIARNFGKLTSATISSTMDLVKPRTAPVGGKQTIGTRSKTVMDIKATLANKPTTSKQAGMAASSSTVGATGPASRKPVTTTTTTATRPPVKRAAVVETKAKPAVKRIPPYDYKARFNDLTEKHKALKEKYENQRQQLAHFDDLPDQYEQCKVDLAAATTEITQLKAQLAVRDRENNELNVLNAELEDKNQKAQARVDHFEQYCPKLEDELSTLKETFKKTEADNIHFKQSIEHLEGELRLCADQLFCTNIERKNLHNEIMDLRGNIRVFCRVRPPLSGEISKRVCQWNYLDECSLEVQNVDEKCKSSRHDFAFDHVFHPNSLQLDIFEMVAPLIQSALDGYNVCIFAYGQTGSGKTYTMDGVPENLGVIPRTVDLLFKAVRDYRRLGWEYEIHAQFLEIYNEVLYDLLSNEDKKLDICMVSPNNKTEVYVSNLTDASVETEDELRQLIDIAKTNRMTACTAGNERSSRSHAVTKITLIGTHAGKQERCIGNINLVDLAGSESPKTSQRMDETKSINKSLSELSNVILALVQRNEHIPYRNSKLTHLLMPSLGGNSKTLMFVNVAPFTDCHAETIKSLRFAATVNSCKMAKVRKNRVLNTTS